MSDGLCPGRKCTSSVRSRSSIVSPSCSSRVTVDLRAPGAERARDRLERLHDVRREMPWRSMIWPDELVVGRRALRVVRDERHGRVDRRHLGARVRRDDLDQPDVVDVLVRDDHELDVLDRLAVRGERVLRARRARGRSSGPASTSVSGSSSIR